MIVRIWHGWTTLEDADRYETLLREEIFAGIRKRNIRGFLGIELIRRQTDEEMEFVTSQQQDGKKVYTITETGLAYLSEKAKETSDVKAQMKNWWGCYGAEFKDEFRDVMKTFGDLGKTIGQKARQAGAEKLPLVKQVLADAGKEIERIFKS